MSDGLDLTPLSLSRLIRSLSRSRSRAIDSTYSLTSGATDRILSEVTETERVFKAISESDAGDRSRFTGRLV